MIHIPKLKLVGDTIQLTYDTIEIPPRYARAATHDSTGAPNARLGIVESSLELLPYICNGIVTFDVPQGTTLEEVYLI